MVKILKRLKGKFNKLSKRNQKMVCLCTILTFSVVPLFAFTGCKLACQQCGSVNTNLLVYASGIDGSIEYTSCLCPSGWINCGLGTSCLPTECLKVKYKQGNEIVEGTIKYYHSFGCINEENGSMSHGEYTISKEGIAGNITSESYVENITKNGTSATESSNCLGCQGEDTATLVRNYNKYMPQQYPLGCSSFFGE